MASNPKKTILQILPALQSGGVERGTIDVARAIKDSGHRSLVMSKGGLLVKQLKKSRIHHIELDVATKNPIKIFLNYYKISKILQEFKVDLVDVRSRAPMWSANRACRKNNVKIVSTIHGPYSIGDNFLVKFFKKFYNSKMFKSDLTIVVSNFIKDYVTYNYDYDKNNLRVVHRGVDIDKFNEKKITKKRIRELIRKWHLEDEKRKIILMPARLTSWKGHEFLINALSKVKSDNYLCLLVGSNHGHESFEIRLKNQIRALGLGNKVKLVGLCEDMPVAYFISDFVICPSIKPEAFGRVPIEAQSMKKVIIATAIGGALETVIENKSGFLIEPNEVEDLANLIEVLLGFDVDKLYEIGEVGRKNVVRNFSNKKMIIDTLKVYEELLV